MEGIGSKECKRFMKDGSVIRAPPDSVCSPFLTREDFFSYQCVLKSSEGSQCLETAGRFSLDNERKLPRSPDSCFRCAFCGRFGSENLIVGWWCKATWLLSRVLSLKSNYLQRRTKYGVIFVVISLEGRANNTNKAFVKGLVVTLCSGVDR